MNVLQKKNKYKYNTNWYVGFLGIIGLYKCPIIWQAVQGDGSLWDLTNLLWLLWFSYFIPENI